MNNAYITGQRVTDSRDASKIGTVVETRGGMWNDSAVLVHWDYLGYANWEMPAHIRSAETARAADQLATASDRAETRAVNRLRRAMAAYEAVMAKHSAAAHITGSPIDLERREAYNDLQNALWPFTTGKYALPEDMKSGL